MSPLGTMSIELVKGLKYMEIRGPSGLNHFYDQQEYCEDLLPFKLMWKTKLILQVKKKKTLKE